MPKSSRKPSFDFAKRRNDLITSWDTPNASRSAIVVCDPIDIAYLTGVTEGISWLAIWEDGGFAISRHMLIREVVDVIGDFEVLLPAKISTDRVNLEAFLSSELLRRGFQVLTVDPARMNAATYMALEKQALASGLDIHSAPLMVSRRRQCKEAGERGVIMRCVEIAEQALIGLLESGSGGLIGRTELEISRELESRMVALGADRQGFPGTGIIVASGPNSGSAHHRPGARRVEKGETLLIDWGAELDGYRSDMTRTLFMEELPEYAQAAYPVVLRALEKAAKVLKPGATMGAADAAARDTVMAAGFTEFHYGVGHGIGLEIHEAPWLRAHSDELLQCGMITTVEPGIYLHDEGGIRIESIYAVTEQGSERLDQLPTSLEHMIIGKSSSPLS